MSAFAGGAAPHFHAELSRFESEFAIIIIEGHHVWCDGKGQCFAFACFEIHTLKTNEMMEGNNGRGAVAQVIKEGKDKTYDMGGKTTTLQMAEAIARKL